MKLQKSEYLDIPHGNSTVWRYMDSCKFTHLLNNSSLFFPNANKLTDQYEVSIPDISLLKKRKELEMSGLTGRDLEEEMASFYWSTNPMKDLVLINCWSVNPHENYALWKIYLGGEKNGVAIKSTVSKLRKSVEQGRDPYPETFFIGKVKYKKHLEHDELSRLNIITTKKPFYDFEKELRVFILNYPRSEGGTVPPYDISVGRNVKVDLKHLIHQVYVSPFADESYRIEIEKLLLNSRETARNVTVKESEIREQ
ncbi:MAG: hypothetical protein JRG71_01770 [Deltaproteobacteria bacterium]|nr:hypothetical protein [Deltaproteobacteria bacterium]